MYTKRFLHIILMLIFIVGVTGLGYFAYKISTQTLVFSYSGQESQKGLSLLATVHSPHFGLTSHTSDMLIDSEAVKDALMINGVSYRTLPSTEANAIEIEIGKDVISVRSSFFKDGDIVRISSDIYNKKKITYYRLAKDITLTVDQLHRNLGITPIGDPKESKYKVVIQGFQDMGVQDMQWYIAPNTSKGCFDDAVGHLWDAQKYKKLTVHLEDIVTEGNNQIATAYVDKDISMQPYCLIVGISNIETLVESVNLKEFTLTGSVIDMISPEYSMQTRMGINFSHPIFTDTGKLYSDEYIQKRDKEKQSILTKIHISPKVHIDTETIELTPKGLKFLGDFKENTKYHITLHDIEDIYGRVRSWSMDITPKSEPFLSIGFSNKKTIIPVDTPIKMKLFATSTPKNSYTVKMCRLNPDDYGRIERIIFEKNKKDIPILYNILHGSTVSHCVKKDIPLTSGAHVVEFTLQDMVDSSRIDPGLYMVAIANEHDITAFDRFILPKTFAVIDSHITLKINNNNDAQFLVTDLKTGAPKANQSIDILENIHQDYSFEYFPKREKKRLPVTNAIFNKKMHLGKTNDSGILAVSQEQLKKINPSFSWYSSENGVLTLSHDPQSYGFVVNTWTDGIQETTGISSNEWWYDSSRWRAYIHTDRRLYLPGDTVHIHAIVREKGHALRVPENKRFTIQIFDNQGESVFSATESANEFGTILADYVIPKNATLGYFNIFLSLADVSNADSMYISNGDTGFQVEVFQNPTFTAKVSLQSPEIVNDIIEKGLREEEKGDVYKYKQYTAPINLEGIVTANYYNGTAIKGVPFQYRVFKEPYYSSDFWDDCFWGCYWGGSQEFHTEGVGRIDNDGKGIVRIPVTFESSYDDYMYTIEVTLRDPITGEEVTTPASLVAKLPEQYKIHYSKPLKATFDHRLIHPGEMFHAKFSFGKRDWTDTWKGKYQYKMFRRTYEAKVVDDLRVKEVLIPKYNDTLVLSGSIDSADFSLSTETLQPGEYRFEVSPVFLTSHLQDVQSNITNTILYIGNTDSQISSEVGVVPEKLIYHEGETARVFFISPFSNGYLYITLERDGIVSSEYVKMQGTMYSKEYTVDDTFYPNIYIGAIAFPEDSTASNKKYSVGYGELITDMTDKKLQLTVTPNKNAYKNREKVTIDLAMKSQGNAIEGEFSVMVVDESLIRLLGNIDLDIIPKFYQKINFSMLTSLTAIGMERNKYLSRVGINGGSGSKGGGSSLSIRGIFKNTAYFNGSIRSDKNGNAQVSFNLPDNVTDYRIIVVGQTKNSSFGVTEQTIQVRRDYTLEAHVPTFAYPGDTFTIDVGAFNATQNVTNANVSLEIGTGAMMVTDKKDITINAGARQTVQFDLQITDQWKGLEIPYTLTLKQGDVILDSLAKTINIHDIPLLESNERQAGSLSGSQNFTLSSGQNIDEEKSIVEIRGSPSFLMYAEPFLKNLVHYPYGCSEQRTSATYGNVLFLKFANLLKHDMKKEEAEKNIREGIQQILKLQLPSGGWKYWESNYTEDNNVTPYVVRSLIEMKNMGIDIPQSAINNGVQYLANLVRRNDPDIAKNQELLTDVFYTLAIAKSQQARATMKDIRADELSTGSYLRYMQGLALLGISGDDKNLEKVSKNKHTQALHYESDNTVRAREIYFLLEKGEIETGTKLLHDLLKKYNPHSYFISTQENIQFLRMVLLHYQKTHKDDAFLILQHQDIQEKHVFDKDSGIVLWKGPRKDFLNFSLTPSDGSTIRYEILEKNVPKDIAKEQGRDSGSIQLDRVIEYIDTAKGVDKKGNFLSVEAVKGDILKHGELYRMTISTKFLDDDLRGKFVIENFLSAGIRVINTAFQTESQILKDNNQGWWWHVESRPERILAEHYYEKLQHSKDANVRTYVYYFRPEFRGTYLLPPTATYMMYQPEHHNVSGYQKITVQ